MRQKVYKNIIEFVFFWAFTFRHGAYPERSIFFFANKHHLEIVSWLGMETSVHLVRDGNHCPLPFLNTRVPSGLNLG